jgi:hypothetical protein
MEANGWRRVLESNDIQTGCEPEHPYLQRNFSIDSKGVQEVFVTAHLLPALTRHVHPACPVIEEFVEGFIEGFS